MLGGVIWLPQGSLKPSLLQTVPQLLGLSPPHISPRCCLLRLGYLPPPAVVQGRVRPRAATGELAGGKTLSVSCPMDRGGGGRKTVALNRVQNETRHTSSVLLLQGGCTGLCHRTAVLWLPGEHEGPGECLFGCPYELSLWSPWLLTLPSLIALPGSVATLCPGRGSAPQSEVMLLLWGDLWGDTQDWFSLQSPLGPGSLRKSRSF